MSTASSMPSMKDLEVRIHRGACHFDSIKKNWTRDVQVRKIDLSNPQTSPAVWVLGPDWDEKVTVNEAYAWGLDFSLLDLSRDDHRSMLDLINRMWKQQITIRRAKKSPRTDTMVAESV